LQDGTRLSDTLKTPLVAVLGRDLLNVSQFTIIVEKQALVTVSDFRKALVTLIASYYCFNIQYSKALSYLLNRDHYWTSVNPSNNSNHQCN